MLTYYFCKWMYNNLYSFVDLIHTCHICSYLSIIIFHDLAIFLALAQKHDNPFLIQSTNILLARERHQKTQHWVYFNHCKIGNVGSIGHNDQQPSCHSTSALSLCLH